MHTDTKNNVLVDAVMHSLNSLKNVPGYQTVSSVARIINKNQFTTGILLRVLCVLMVCNTAKENNLIILLGTLYALDMGGNSWWINSALALYYILKKTTESTGVNWIDTNNLLILSAICVPGYPSSMLGNMLSIPHATTSQYSIIRFAVIVIRTRVMLTPLEYKIVLDAIAKYTSLSDRIFKDGHKKKIDAILMLSLAVYVYGEIYKASRSDLIVTCIKVMWFIKCQQDEMQKKETEEKNIISTAINANEENKNRLKEVQAAKSAKAMQKTKENAIVPKMPVNLLPTQEVSAGASIKSEDSAIVPEMSVNVLHTQEVSAGASDKSEPEKEADQTGNKRKRSVDNDEPNDQAKKMCCGEDAMQLDIAVPLLLASA